MLKRCKTCGTELIEGPSQERSAESSRFRVVVTGIPVRVCPKGCPGDYWYWPNLSLEVLGLLKSIPNNLAKRKGLFKIQQVCRRCGRDLTDEGRRETFTFGAPCRKGTMIEMAVSGASLTCNRCNLHFLPVQIYSRDAYYSDLANVITEALTTDLIWG
jgi:hypothetical protein